MTPRQVIDYAKQGLPPFNSFTLMLMIVWTFIFYQVLQVFWFERFSPTYIYEEGIVNPHNVYRRDALTMNVKLARNRPCSVIVTRYIQDAKGLRIDLPATVIPITRPGYEQYTRQFAIPFFAEKGKASINITSAYACHWSHAIWPIIVPRSYEFNITE
jgi:hypothetical protein